MYIHLNRAHYAFKCACTAMSIILCIGVTWSLVDSLVLLTKDLAMLVHCTCVTPSNKTSCQPCTRSNVLLEYFISGLQRCRELFVFGNVISELWVLNRE